jgi:parvulin-like peptidyl-prolyl isomerase
MDVYVQIVEAGHKIEHVAERHPEAEIVPSLWIGRGVKPPEVERVAWRLEIGQISEPIETPDGFCVILRCG